MASTLITNEIQHGERLAAGNTEILWGWGTPAGRKRAERRGWLISKAGDLGPNKRVLEIGCGTGLFTEMFAATGADVTAVDLSPVLLAKARARRLPADRIRFLEKPFEECEADGHFDAVIGSSVLHHLDMSRALPKIFALLKPGGCFSFAEPNMLNPQVWAERHFRSFFPYVSPDETAFTRWALKNQIVASGSDLTQRGKSAVASGTYYGFTNITIIPFDWLHPAVPQSLIGIVLAVGALFERLPFIREFAGSLLISARKPPLSVGGGADR